MAVFENCHCVYMYTTYRYVVYKPFNFVCAQTSLSLTFVVFAVCNRFFWSSSTVCHPTIELTDVTIYYYTYFFWPVMSTGRPSSSGHFFSFEKQIVFYLALCFACCCILFFSLASKSLCTCSKCTCTKLHLFDRVF